MKHILWKMTKIVLFPLSVPIFIAWIILVHICAAILMILGIEVSLGESSPVTDFVTWLYNEFIEDSFVTTFWVLSIIVMLTYAKINE